MSRKSESLILCEGFHDRAFFAGWLEHLGCGARRDGPRGEVIDPWGLEVRHGQFGFRTPSNRFVRVVQCNGDVGVLRATKLRLGELDVKGLDTLIVCIDADRPADEAHPQQRAQARIGDAVHRAVDAAKERDGGLELPGGAVAYPLVWLATDAPAEGLPSKQTLERLACASIQAAHQERGPLVESWLESIGEASQRGPKEYAWSHMAGWYAERGCDNFLRALWQDAMIVEQLQERLSAIGAWDVVARAVE